MSITDDNRKIITILDLREGVNTVMNEENIGKFHLLDVHTERFVYCLNAFLIIHAMNINVVVF